MAIAVIIVLALGVGFAVAAVLAISRRHYEIVTMTSRVPQGSFPIGSGGGHALVFAGAEAVRLGIGFIGTAVMLGGWGAALASAMGRRKTRWATAALVASRSGSSRWSRVCFRRGESDEARS